MNNQFDELAKGMAQSVTRRGALKKFGVGLAGLALAALGLANRAKADPVVHCESYEDCAGLGAGFACCKGKCINLDFDIHNCGSCGNHCAGGKYSVCNYGFCSYDYPV